MYSVIVASNNAALNRGNNMATIHASTNELQDGSLTFDVYASDEDGQVLLAEPPTFATADAIAESMQWLLTRFLDCGSDREVLSLVISFDNWKAKHQK